MAAKTYRLRIGGEGKEFEAEGDKAFVLAMAKLYGPNAPIKETSKGGKETSSSKKAAEKELAKLAFTTKSVSIREFVQQLGLKKHTDISLAFGYYLEHHGGKTDFSSADLNNCYYEAKMEASNTSQMIVLNIRSGRMMQAKGDGGKKRRFTLTKSGEDYIEKISKKSVAAE